MKIKKEKNLLNSIYYRNELSNNIRKNNIIKDIKTENTEIEPTKEIKLKNIKNNNIIYDDNSYTENNISRIPNSNDEILEHVNKYKNNDNFCKDEIVDIVRDNKLNNDINDINK